MHSFTKLVVPPLSALALTASLTGAAWAHTSTVNVSLWDKGADAGMATGMGMGMPHADMSKATMGIKISEKSVEAGKVTFKVINKSKDSMHEMVVAKLGAKTKELPYSKSMNEVEESRMDNLGEVEELDPGASGTLTLNLKPGKYVLFCNIPGHYMDGMWTVLTVS